MSKVSYRLMQMRDLFLIREHYGWANYLARKASRLPGPPARVAERLSKRLENLTDARSVAFDRQHGTETFRRGDYPVREGIPASELSWGYAPVNQDFFREMLRAVPADLSRYSFVDVGAGKGAALMLASEFGFREYVGVELSAELIELGRENIARYVASTGRALDPRWVHADFLTWPIPAVDTLFFINNSLPADIAVCAVKRIEEAALAHGRSVLLLYRKVAPAVARELNDSQVWRALRLSPYWRVDAINATTTKRKKLGARRFARTALGQ